MGAKEDAFDNRDRKDLLTVIIAAIGLALIVEANVIAFLDDGRTIASNVVFTAGLAAVSMLLLRVFVAEPLSGPNKPVKP